MSDTDLPEGSESDAEKYDRLDFELELEPFETLVKEHDLKRLLKANELETLSECWQMRNALTFFFTIPKGLRSELRNRIHDSATNRAEEQFMTLRNAFLNTAEFQALPENSKAAIRSFLSDIQFE